MTRTITTDPRERMIAGLGARERSLELNGVTTPILEAGEGRPIVALHGPGANATHWAEVIPALSRSHRFVAPDLPGQGQSKLGDAELTGELVLAWLEELIETTCDAPPVLVGVAAGGAIGARYAADPGRPIEALVLVDALGLREFEPTPEFGAALNAFVAEPTTRTHELLWRQCALDLDRVRERMGERWDAFEAYNVDRATDPGVQAALGAMLNEFVVPAIPAAELDRIAVPTTLIWGRQDRATPVEVAERASARHGWQLTVIESCADDPPVEQPEAFVEALRAAVGNGAGR